VDSSVMSVDCERNVLCCGATKLWIGFGVKAFAVGVARTTNTATPTRRLHAVERFMVVRY